jgi:hypothetical protein
MGPKLSEVLVGTPPAKENVKPEAGEAKGSKLNWLPIAVLRGLKLDVKSVWKWAVWPVFTKVSAPIPDGPKICGTRQMARLLCVEFGQGFCANRTGAQVKEEHTKSKIPE